MAFPGAPPLWGFGETRAVAAVYDRRQYQNCEIAGGHFLRLRATALALRGPPLQSVPLVFRLSPVLYKFETEAAFDTQMAVRDADVKRRRDLHDAIVLDVKR